jgi:hypothetical protein
MHSLVGTNCMKTSFQRGDFVDLLWMVPAQPLQIHHLENWACYCFASTCKAAGRAALSEEVARPTTTSQSNRRPSESMSVFVWRPYLTRAWDLSTIDPLINTPAVDRRPDQIHPVPALQVLGSPAAATAGRDRVPVISVQDIASSVSLFEICSI